MDTSDPSLIRRLDTIEADAYRDMYAAAGPQFASAVGLATREIGGATLLVAPRIPTPMFNRVIGLGNTQSASADILDEITARFHGAGVRQWWIHLAPMAQPDTLARDLASRGFTDPPRRNWVKFVHDNKTLPQVETGYDIRLVRAEEGQIFGETVCAAFEMPASLAPWYAQLPNCDGWKAVGAFDGDNMVGCALVWMRGKNAWMGADGVLPKARRHRVHRALIAYRVNFALDAGCDCIATETGEPVGDETNPSLRNISTSGYKQIFLRANYAAPVT
jgi:GNAT superfamily N-acetyltransferase